MSSHEFLLMLAGVPKPLVSGVHPGVAHGVVVLHAPNSIDQPLIGWRFVVAFSRVDGCP